MRGWTLGVSIVIHLCIVTGVIVKPLFATDDLPEPPRAYEWIRVRPDLPVVPREPTPARPDRPTTGAPLEASDTVSPEPPDPPEVLPGPTDFDVAGGDTLGGVLVPGVITGGGSDELPPPPLPTPPPAKQIYRVGGDIQPPKKIHDVAPRYPQMALASRTQGIVILEATIGEDGTVRDVRVLRGNQLLDNAAMEAVRQWRFTPPLLNGQPVPAAMTVTVSFTLN